MANMNKLQLFIVIAFFMAILGCNRQNDKIQILQNRIDSLENRLADTYKPGFGEFMSSIQAHHSKLWFAGENQNWKLADFEIHEIMEAIADIQKYETDRKESKLVAMLMPVLDSVNSAIEQKNPASFRRSFKSLTNTCNNCHHAVDFEFNVVKIPDTQPFSNQNFKLNEK